MKLRLSFILRFIFKPRISKEVIEVYTILDLLCSLELNPSLCTVQSERGIGYRISFKNRRDQNVDLYYYNSKDLRNIVKIIDLEVNAVTNITFTGF